MRSSLVLVIELICAKNILGRAHAANFFLCAPVIILTPEILTPFYPLANKNLLAAPDVKRAYIKKRRIAGRVLQLPCNRNRKHKFIQTS